MRILLLLAGLGNARAGAAEPPWDADDALARALRVDDWIRNATDGRAGAPPNHWRVTHPSGLAAAPAPFHFTANNTVKFVFATSIMINATARAVVVKSTKSLEKKYASGLRREALYLEYLRGQPGIPLLHGGYFVKGTLHLVVERCGRQIGDDDHSLYRDYEALAASRPRAVARAWIELFRSVEGRGGFFLRDFKPSQFTCGADARGAPALWLVDGPNPSVGPLAAALRARHAPARMTTHHRDRSLVHDLGRRAWLLPRLGDLAAAGGDSQTASLLRDAVRRCTREPYPTYGDLLALLDSDPDASASPRRGTSSRGAHAELPV